MLGRSLRGIKGSIRISHQALAEANGAPTYRMQLMRQSRSGLGLELTLVEAIVPLGIGRLKRVETLNRAFLPRPNLTK